jgi:hypothetical protein
MDLLPVNISEATVVSRATVLPGLTATRPQPPDVKDLSSWSQENYQLKVKAAAHLGFPVANLNAGLDSDLLIFGTSRWTDVDSGDGHVYRFGVSLRVLVEVMSVDGKIDLTLPAIAANVQLGRAQASAQLVVRGYNSSTLGKLLPPWQAFTVDSYSQYMSAISEIQQAVMQSDANIVPQLLATTLVGPSLPSSAQSIGTVIAVRAVANGDSLNACLKNNDSVGGDVEEAITQAYCNVGLQADDRPTPEVQDKARGQLGPLAQAHHWWNRGDLRGPA